MDSPPSLPPLNSLPPVNWDALDALVLDFARSDRLVVPPHADAADATCPSPPSSPSSCTTTATSSVPSSSSSSSSSYRSRLLILRARRALEAGDVDAALALLRAHAPAALADHRLLFHLHKQRFVELVRRGTEADRKAALDCLRTALAPCALDAYPEAYEEFKHIMLVLIYEKDDQFSPVVNEWSIKRRFELAGLLSSILRAHLRAYDPILSMTLRYLISIHKVYCMREGISSPISDLTERLLFEDRDPPVVPQECSLEAPPFDEVDVQALAHAVELTRQGAVDSLKFTKGDLYQAFQNELCRRKLDLTLLDKLVHEYCIYRGIVEGGSRILPGISELKCSQNNNSNNETVSECEMANNQNGDCSTSDISRDDSWSRRLRRVRSSTSEQRRRKRWRGRVDDLDYACEALLDANKHDSSSPALDMDEDNVVDQQDLVANSNTPNTRNMDDQKYEVVLEMQDLIRKGMASKVVEEISSIDPEFFPQNPILLFQLKQVEFLKLVAFGDHVAALKVASTHLGPLASNNQALLKPLKETLVTLIKPNEDVLNGVSLPVLASSLQVAMSRRLGIKEPQLMKIVRAAIHTHTEWFKLQMCKDRFEHFLKIDSLKEVDPPVGSCSMSKGHTDECGNGSSQITTCSSGKVPDEGSSPQVSSEPACDENAILKVMFSGKRVGIIGLGRIGLAVAKRVEAFSCPVSYYQRRKLAAYPNYTYRPTAVELAASSDVLVVACSLNEQSRRIVSREVMEALGPSGVLVNVGRGAHVDEPELVAALADGRLGGAGLDVFEDEPDVPEALVALDNVVLAPHVGSGTHETRRAMADLVLGNLEAHVLKKPLLTPVV